MPAPSIEKIVKVITQALSDDKSFSVGEAMELVSGKTLGPAFEKSEYEAVNVVYQNIVSGKVSADDGVAKILKDKLDGGFVEDSSNPSGLKVAGYTVGGAGVGAMIAALIILFLGATLGTLLVAAGIGAGIGALLGFGTGATGHSFGGLGE